MTIQLSPQHGLNPSISICFFCGEDKNELIIPGKLKGDQQAPHKAVWNKEPCEKCVSYMQQGIIFIGVDEDKSVDMDNPYRTGKFCVLTEDAVIRMFNPGHFLQSILSKRMAFVPEQVWKALRLP